MKDYKAKYEYSGCPLCYGIEGEHCQIIPNSHGDYTIYDCYVCGRFRLTGTVIAGSTQNSNLLMSEQWRASLSHQFRNAADTQTIDEYKTPMISSDVIERCRRENPVLPTPSQQLYNLVRLVGNQFISDGTSLLPDGRTRVQVGAINSSQMNSVRRMGIQSGFLIESGTVQRINSRGGNVSGKGVELSWSGWEKYESLKHGRTSGSFGFIAMKYDEPDLEALVKNVVKPDVLESTGYEVVDLRDVSQAGVIDNLLRQQLRDAAFVIVDLTHDNAGAYWEAGFSEGIGKPVIYICEQNKFDEKKTHFDTNHCTTVLWTTGDSENFSKELAATIRRSLNLFS